MSTGATDVADQWVAGGGAWNLTAARGWVEYPNCKYLMAFTGVWISCENEQRGDDKWDIKLEFAEDRRTKKRTSSGRNTMSWMKELPLV